MVENRELNTSSIQAQEYPDVFQCLNVHVTHGYDSCSYYKLSIYMSKLQWFCWMRFQLNRCASLKMMLRVLFDMDGEHDALNEIGLST